MDRQEQRKRQIHTFERHLGIALFEHGDWTNVPTGKKEALRQRAKALGVDLDKEYDLDSRVEKEEP